MYVLLAGDQVEHSENRHLTLNRRDCVWQCTGTAQVLVVFWKGMQWNAVLTRHRDYAKHFEYVVLCNSYNNLVKHYNFNFTSIKL